MGEAERLRTPCCDKNGPGEKLSLREKLGKGEVANELMPMPPEEGPPLPRLLNIKWPWQKD